MQSFTTGHVDDIGIRRGDGDGTDRGCGFVSRKSASMCGRSRWSSTRRRSLRRCRTRSAELGTPATARVRPPRNGPMLRHCISRRMRSIDLLGGAKEVKILKEGK